MEKSRVGKLKNIKALAHKPDKSPDEHEVLREIPMSHWHNQHGPYPIMRNYLAVKINATTYLDTIESDVITKATEASEFSNLHAWCWNEDMQMLFSNKTMTLQSARTYCQGDDSLI